MSRKTNGSAFNDLYLLPLQRDLQEAQKKHGIGTPAYKLAESRARMVHGLRMENEILRRNDVEGEAESNG